MPATSVPERGSVTAAAPIFSPLASDARKRWRCASLPCSRMPAPARALGMLISTPRECASGGVGDGGGPGAPPARRDRAPDRPELAQARDQVRGQPLLAVVLADPRRHLLPREAADRLDAPVVLEDRPVL